MYKLKQIKLFLCIIDGLSQLFLFLLFYIFVPFCILRVFLFYFIFTLAIFHFHTGKYSFSHQQMSTYDPYNIVRSQVCLNLKHHSKYRHHLQTYVNSRGNNLSDLIAYKNASKKFDIRDGSV